jgi:hypothetical protein
MATSTAGACRAPISAELAAAEGQRRPINNAPTPSMSERQQPQRGSDPVQAAGRGNEYPGQLKRWRR